MNDIIDSYFAAKQKLEEAFSYKENWRVIPWDDQRGQHWMLVGGNRETGEGSVCAYAPTPFTEELIKASNGFHYSGPVYTQRHLSTWVYRTETHVMICVDTQTDDNKFLMIFDTALECTDKNIQELYSRYW